MTLFKMHLPYPPSINHYYVRSSKKCVILSAKAREYKELVAWNVCLAKKGVTIEIPIVAWIELYPPDGRKRDTDNPQKAVFDSLEYANVIANDKLIVEHHVKMFPKKPPNGLIYVVLEDAKDSEWKKN
jgi:crossover junction endodeoxyribonuclease RusA